ncbi:MAG TPA: type II secretion system F family protein [Acidimicrobiales bacterium]|nr:type II secretion system F family protein [Acidimicrobiales bacterium]
MPKFAYTAQTADGRTVKGIEDALTVSMARRALVAKQLAPVEVAERKSIMQFELTRKKVSRRELMHFSRQMGVFLRSGIPVLEALDVMCEDTSDKLLQRVVAEMGDSLRAGETLADAADKHPEAFPPFYLGILRSAEVSGNLDTVLDQLSDYLERDDEARRKITSALIYPSLVLALSIVAVVVITTFVLPKFKTFFASLNAKLPLPTRILLDITKVLTDQWYIFVGIAAIAVLAVVLAMTTEQGKEIRDKVVIQVPVLGDLVTTAILERFCRIMYSMVAAGVPIPEALMVTSQATSNGVFQRGLSSARDGMLRGEGLAGPLSATGLFPTVARHMFRVGESTGSMDDQLETAANYFDRELTYKLAHFTSLFEPAVLVFVGVVVGFVAIALISAMYGIFHQVKV